MSPAGPDERLAGPGEHAAVPPDAGELFERLLLVMDRLRSPGGCEWDGAQTHESLLRYLIEETYEVVEAVEAPGRGWRDDLVEELGDVLLQVVFHARIGQEHAAGSSFDITDVLAAVTDKLVRRHPLVFAGDRQADAAGPASGAPGRVTTTASGSLDEELSARWDAVKRAEKPHRTGVFDGIPPALPALAYAEKALSKARRHGVEPRSTPRDARDGARDRAETELGERLFEQVRAASSAGLDAERALRETVRRYIRANNRSVSDTPGADR